ncbi:hypothetical protein MLD38_020320 [Melastoma candidum]|uniref:Uncharacterized protein n=1 Tax=Melastoma candidum TaxID=119954 RepID=A0ACB9QKK3_9MYRT|nr:hypothetical protein MLD38_020320 [Melastoma candidum]
MFDFSVWDGNEITCFLALDLAAYSLFFIILICLLSTTLSTEPPTTLFLDLIPPISIPNWVDELSIWPPIPSDDLDSVVPSFPLVVLHRTQKRRQHHSLLLNRNKLPVSVPDIQGFSYC